MWVTLISPILMFFLITKVTGIPPTERQALKSRGDDYKKYQKETSPFIPWFPKGSV
jgi:steroid 5-alpha reductase family enzyme